VPAVPTVLIVDDHPSFRATARLLLEADGYAVVGEAPDGTSALRQAAALAPDVVLLDVNLPDLDGFAVAERLTADGGGPAVVLCSSRDAGDLGERIERSGARGFVAKAELSGARLRRRALLRDRRAHAARVPRRPGGVAVRAAPGGVRVRARGRHPARDRHHEP
jgi:DNA-binding NarL/FixJ family response regulator